MMALAKAFQHKQEVQHKIEELFIKNAGTQCDSPADVDLTALRKLLQAFASASSLLDNAKNANFHQNV